MMDTTMISSDHGERMTRPFTCGDRIVSGDDRNTERMLFDCADKAIQLRGRGEDANLTIIFFWYPNISVGKKALDRHELV